MRRLRKSSARFILGYNYKFDTSSQQDTRQLFSMSIGRNEMEMLKTRPSGLNR